MLWFRRRDECDARGVEAPAGSTLVFYTDGLIKATRDIEEGQRRLYPLLAAHRVGSPPPSARTTVENVLAGEDASDDIAVLVAHVGRHEG